MKTLIFALALLCHPGSDCHVDKPETYSAKIIAPEPCKGPFECLKMAQELVAHSALRGEPGSWWLFSALRADRD